MTTEQHNTDLPSGRIRHALEAMEWFEQQPNCDSDSYASSLNFFRIGDIGIGFEEMGLRYEHGIKFDRKITDFHKNREQFFTDMRKLADDLEAEGY